MLKEDTLRQIGEKKNDLSMKQDELDVIVKETQDEEKKLLASSKDAAKKVEPRIINAYHKIRRNMRNGLAVVSTDRDACGGCFAVIPPQLHLEIRQKKKLLVCENCGRLLVDASFFKASEELLHIHH